MNLHIIIIAIAITSLAPVPAHSKDFMDGVILDIFTRQQGKFVCLTSKSNLQIIKTKTKSQLKIMKAGKHPSANEIASAIYTRFPCPFSPNRSEFRPATLVDLEGNWLYPETSQKLRHGPNSPLWQQQKYMPIKCETIVYSSDGSAHTARIVGKGQCLTSKKDLEFIKSTPKVETWSFIKEGRFLAKRSDVNLVQEWDVFVVKRKFKVANANITLMPGDLVQYLRREPENDYNVSTVFRHLQKIE